MKLKWKRGRHKIKVSEHEFKSRAGVQNSGWAIRKEGGYYWLTQRKSGHYVGDSFKTLKGAKIAAEILDLFPEITRASKVDQIDISTRKLAKSLLAVVMEAERAP